MAMNITEAGYKELLEEGKPVVIDFWAEWCGPCRAITPIIEELAGEYEGKVIIGKCNVDEENEMAARFSVRSIPTIVFLKPGGEQNDKLVGAASKAVIKEKVDALL